MIKWVELLKSVGIKIWYAILGLSVSYVLISSLVVWFGKIWGFGLFIALGLILYFAYSYNWMKQYDKR